MAIATRTQAAAHIGLSIVFDTSPVDPRQADLELKLLAAEATVINYLKTYEFPEDARPLVQAAVLLQFGELWRFRGDDPEGQGPAQTAGDLSPLVTNLLRRLRDPALA